jgi:HAD superfamily hydrolase (TIGR01549 family)
VIDTVLFDWRGTIFTDEVDPTWIRNAAASVGRTLDETKVSDIVARLGEAEKQPTINAALAACDHSLEANREAMLSWFRAAGIDDELAEAIWARDGHPDASFPYPETREVLAELHAREFRIAVVSDIHYDIRDHFRRHDLDRFVDGYVLSVETGFQKPDPRMFLAALELVGSVPSRALMVGDRYDYDGAAAALGITCLILPPTPPGASHGLDAVLRLVG